MANLNKNEKSLIEKIQSMYCEDGELELAHHVAGEVETTPVSGWYPYVYKESQGRSIPFPDKSFAPVITDAEAAKKSIDVGRCLCLAGCYYVG